MTLRSEACTNMFIVAKTRRTSSSGRDTRPDSSRGIVNSVVSNVTDYSSDINMTSADSAAVSTIDTAGTTIITSARRQHMRTGKPYVSSFTSPSWPGLQVCRSGVRTNRVGVRKTAIMVENVSFNLTKMLHRFCSPTSSSIFTILCLICLLCFPGCVEGLGEITWAVNCGGGVHTDIHGIRYQADYLKTGIASDYGKNLMIQRIVPQDQILYQTERYHTSTFGYEIPIKEDGDYVLTLKFCEVWFTSPNQKVRPSMPYRLVCCFFPSFLLNHRKNVFSTRFYTISIIQYQLKISKCNSFFFF
ncbi:uncharacterized protein LOC106881727 [Octopus bimaculoides]|nr:uncharacterized protein LOC106881727 [Octopus bimaculoides]